MLKINLDEDFNEEEFDNDELDLFYLEDEEDFIDPDFDQELAYQFADDIMDFLNYCVIQSDVLEEDFVSQRCLLNHFTKHCMGHTNKKSTRGRILYDFNDNSKYSTYEKDISSKIKDTNYKIGSLYDYPTIMKYMRKLFEGNITVQFCNSCCINHNGPINLSFISYANDVTKNYKGGNTITMCIKNDRHKTISLYAVDAHDVEKRLNSTLKNYANLNNNFAFNND